jgi:hypothetical protein
MPSLDDQIDTLELVNKEVLDRLTRLSASGSQVDTKSALVAGVAATATQFLATRQAPQPTFSALAFTAFAIAFATAVAAYAVTRHQDVPDPNDLAQNFVQRTKAETLAVLIATRARTFKVNIKKHRRKVRLWWVSVCFLSLGLALSTLAIVQNTVP